MKKRAMEDPWSISAKAAAKQRHQKQTLPVKKKIVIKPFKVPPKASSETHQQNLELLQGALRAVLDKTKFQTSYEVLYRVSCFSR